MLSPTNQTEWQPKPLNIKCDRTNQQDSGQISVDRSTTAYSQHLQYLDSTKSSAKDLSFPKSEITISLRAFSSSETWMQLGKPIPCHVAMEMVDNAA